MTLRVHLPRFGSPGVYDPLPVPVYGTGTDALIVPFTPAHDEEDPRPQFAHMGVGALRPCGQSYNAPCPYCAEEA